MSQSCRVEIRITKPYLFIKVKNLRKLTRLGCHGELLLRNSLQLLHKSSNVERTNTADTAPPTPQQHIQRVPKASSLVTRELICIDSRRKEKQQLNLVPLRPCSAAS